MNFQHSLIGASPTKEKPAVVSDGQSENERCAVKIPSSRHNASGNFASLEELKTRVNLREVFERDGHTLRRSGSRLGCLCPFHEERKPSCVVDETSFHCFGCGASGDVFDYIQQRDGGTLIEAKQKVAAMLGVGFATNQQTSRHLVTAKCEKVAEAIYRMSDEDLKRAGKAVETLYSNPMLIERIAKWRGWKTETIRNLTPDLSLGMEGGKLAFTYASCMKLRWLENGGRRISFAFGKAQSLWRQHAIFPSTQIIYVCEGETDAITLLDAGLEDDGSCKTAVVALPSASTMRREWASLFDGKRAVLCFDNDAAGNRATEKFAEMLRGHAAKIHRFDLANCKDITDFRDKIGAENFREIFFRKAVAA